MSILLTGAGGLFTRLGKLGKVLRQANTYAAGDLPSTIGAAISNLDPPEIDIASPLSAGLPGFISSANSVGNALQAAAQAILLKMVYTDVPMSNNNDVTAALTELISQMKAGGYYVNPYTTLVFATPGTNTGTGNVVVSNKRGDGLIQQNAFAEISDLSCTGDSQSRTATANAEPFIWKGDQAVTDVNADTWPGPSGQTASLQVVDSQPNGNGQLLTNGAFESFTTNTPDNWTIVTGTAGGTVFQENTIKFRGASGLKILGNGSELTTLTQVFNDAVNGNSTFLLPEQTYFVNLFVRVSSVPAAGVLTIDLIDGSNATINDSQGVANSGTIALTGLSTSFAVKSFAFRTPHVMPSTIKLRLKLTTALDSGKSVYIDELAFTQPTRLYPGGPALAIFAADVPFVTGDRFDVTIQNNRASSTFGGSWNTLFDRWFNMRQLGLLLPYTGSTLIPDTLITA